MKLPYIYLCYVLLLSCHSSHKASNSSTTCFAVSPLTSSFIERLKQENPAKPSATFINDFNLLTIKGQYYVSGLAKVDSALDEKKLEQINAHVNTRAGNIFTLQIPIVNFNKFLQSNGIDYFEIGARVNIK